jgi:uncharacterized membrane protein (UPF0136 family)
MQGDHMPITEPPAAPAAARNTEAGLLLIALGAILLLISLFLEWFEPGIEAWDVFEVWDLVLAALAIAALVAVAGRMGYGPPRSNSWLMAAGIVAFVVVVASLLDHPPAADQAGQDPSTGLWLALVASVLMLAGTALSVARISVALNVGDSPVGGPRRFGRGPRAGVDPEYPAQPPVVGTPSAPVAGTPPTTPPVGGPPPTEPTRRL